jgi:NTP pyrophosphatase (non-canonical NTP hydrolase)
MKLNVKPELIRMAFQSAAGRNLKGYDMQEYVTKFLCDLDLNLANPTVMRESAKSGNVDAFGEYTVQHWFAAGAEADPVTEDYEHQKCGKSLTIMSLGLAGEAGEALEKIKKIIRDGTYEPDALKKELGDIEFYWARICRYFGFQPSSVIAANIDKLDDRRERRSLLRQGLNHAQAYRRS